MNIMIEKILNLLREERDFVSGEKLAKELDVTRASIWKYISKLKDMGYNISSITNKGYFLIEQPFIFNKIEIEQAIIGNILGKNCYFFKSITSTNNFAKSLANENGEEGDIVIADEQTEGKGRLDRIWKSDEGQGIYLSLILKPEIELYYSNQITLLAGIALCNSIKDNTNLDAKIKWPNDIVINGKKVCGILCEVNAQIEKVNYIILGIGINVNNEDFGILSEKATSLFIETSRKFERKDILASFLYEFEKMYLDYKESIDFDKFLNSYKSLCISIGKDAKVIYKGKEIFGTVLDVSSKGEILFKTNDEIIKITSGEVSLRNVNGDYI